MSNKVVKCKNCGEEISSKAVVCPKCGVKNKKPFYKRIWFILLAIVVVIAAISLTGGNSDTKPTTKTVENTPAKEIVYTEYTVSQLISDLEANALKAENTYNDKYVKISGKLSNIDSDGSYISLAPSNNTFTLYSVQCYIKNDEQLNKVMEMNIGNNIVISGKITDVGEILGYSLDIDSIE